MWLVFLRRLLAECAQWISGSIDLIWIYISWLFNGDWSQRYRSFRGKRAKRCVYLIQVSHRKSYIIEEERKKNLTLKFFECGFIFASLLYWMKRWSDLMFMFMFNHYNMLLSVCMYYKKKARIINKNSLEAHKKSKSTIYI